VLGYVVGDIIARRPSNIERNDWALSLLRLLKPGGVILTAYMPQHVGACGEESRLTMP
jgi:hypothetical protein